MSAEFDEAMKDVRERFAGIIQVIPRVTLRGIIREPAPHFILERLRNLNEEIAVLQASAKAVLVGYAMAKGWDGNTNTIHYNEETGVFTVTPIPTDSIASASAQQLETSATHEGAFAERSAQTA